MSGLTSVLNIAKGALIVQQKAMNVTGHNIANVNTSGYSRQKVVLESNATLYASQIKIGMGVSIDSVVQYVDQFTNKTIYQKTSILKEDESKSSILSYIETIFNETTEQGLSNEITEFWNAWQDLANNPGGTSERTALLEIAETLCQQFNSMSNDLSEILKDTNTNLSTSIEEANRLTGEIAELNEKIVSAESNQATANDLRDQRANLLTELSELVGNVYLENENGSLTVMTSSGMMLVDGNQNFELSQDGDSIYWNQIESDISGELSGGEIGAWLDIRDEIVPQYLANLDELAGTLINEVNTLHQTGYTLSGETGIYFFENLQSSPNTPNSDDYTGAAAYIKLSSDVEGNADTIAAGGQSGDSGDNENALKIIALQTDGTLQIRKWTYENRGEDVSNSLQAGSMDDYYQALIGELGILTEDVTESQEFTQTMLDNLTELRDSVSGVNLDEEMINLMAAQQAYGAAAKLVSVVDEMLQSLLEMR